MERYEPPFEITNRMLNRVSSISEKLGRIETRRTLERQPHLRRNNRIQSVHSSLKIEANSLSLDSVRDVLNEREVIGPAKEIQEVKNAFAAYDQIDAVDPYSLDDLLRLHGVMTRLTVEESGVFRSGAEGVYRGGVCIHIAPPPEMVPPLMRQLFDWIAVRRGEIHPLILSSVFHYEFVFIHPFRDGNGRMARLWQMALLSRWNPLFEYIPIESQIERFQDGYYDARRGQLYGVRGVHAGQDRRGARPGDRPGARRRPDRADQAAAGGDGVRHALHRSGADAAAGPQIPRRPAQQLPEPGDRGGAHSDDRAG